MRFVLLLTWTEAALDPPDAILGSRVVVAVQSGDVRVLVTVVPQLLAGLILEIIWKKLYFAQFWDDLGFKIPIVCKMLSPMPTGF